MFLFQFPSSFEDWNVISQTFLDRWNFPNCVGALDGKHVTIKPPQHSGSVYYNYKHRFSIVLMALVDAEYRFLYCDVGCNGRVSDGGVFGSCTLNESLQNRTASIPDPTCLPGSDELCSYHIVADDAFPLRDEIMKPFRHRQLTIEQRIFNYRLSRARRCVENAFGILANRFRVFLTTIALAPEKVEQIVLAACALHNYLIDKAKNEYMPPGLVDSENNETHQTLDGSWRQNGLLHSAGLPHNPNSPLSAKCKRDMLVAYFSSDAGRVPWQDSMI